MNGLLDWGGSNYPGETFLSPAPSSRQRAQRAEQGERQAGEGEGSLSGPSWVGPSWASASHPASCPLSWPPDSQGKAQRSEAGLHTSTTSERSGKGCGVERRLSQDPDVALGGLDPLFSFSPENHW